MKSKSIARMTSVTGITTAVILFSMVGSVFAATYDGYGSTSSWQIWFTFTWHSWASVNTSSQTLWIQVAYPYAWYDIWTASAWAFASGVISIQDSQGTRALFWVYNWAYSMGGYDWWSATYTSYSNTNTWILVTVYFVYWGFDVIGTPLARKIDLTYMFWVGA